MLDEMRRRKKAQVVEDSTRWNAASSLTKTPNPLNPVPYLAFLALFVCRLINIFILMAPPVRRRRSLGRRKIEIKLIEDESARSVTFSKRRIGVFKKATELSILCGAHIAIIIFSLAGRPYSFGHPDVDSVLGHFINRNMIPEQPESAQGMRIQGLLVQQLKAQLDQKKEELASKKRRLKELAAELEKSPSHVSEEHLNLLNRRQLKKLRQKLEELREDICQLVKARPMGSEELPDSLDAPGTSVNQGLAVNEEIVSGPSSNAIEVTFANTEEVPRHSVLKEADLANVDNVALTSVQKAVNTATVEDAAGPHTRNEVNLTNVERIRYESPPIPADWLKL